MKHVVYIALLALVWSCSQKITPEDRAALLRAEFSTIEEIQGALTGDPDSALVVAAALKVVPGVSWIKWGLGGGDSITLNGYAKLSQNSANGQERIITDTADREWIASWVPDSVQAALGISDSLSAHLVLIASNGDSIITHRTSINTILDSIAAHRSDIDNIEIPATGYTAFNDTLTFDSSRYYQTFLAIDSIQMTVDTSGQRWGEYTIARVNFGSGNVIMLPSPEFDTLQMYKVASGAYLSGVHMIYFENTPYGVAVSIPTNDSIEYLIDNPSGGITGLEAEWDGKLGVTVDDTITTWVDQASSKSAANTTASSQPIWDGSKVTFDALDDMQFTAGAITTSGAHTWTIAVNLASNKDHIFLGYTSSGFIMQRSAGNNTLLYNIAGLSWTSAHATGNHIYQIVYDGATTTTLYVDGVSAGTQAAPASRTFDMLGNRLPYGGQGMDGSLYYVSYHTTDMDAGERSSMYDYLNERFALGL